MKLEDFLLLVPLAVVVVVQYKLDKKSCEANFVQVGRLRCASKLFLIPGNLITRLHQVVSKI